MLQLLPVIGPAVSVSLLVLAGLVLAGLVHPFTIPSSITLGSWSLPLPGGIVGSALFFALIF